jgi:hypothetical protein
MRDWIDMVRRRFLVHLSRSEHRVVDPEDVYFVQADGRDWEVKLEPPVNAVLPISRDRLAALRKALGG